MTGIFKIAPSPINFLLSLGLGYLTTPRLYAGWAAYMAVCFLFFAGCTTGGNGDNPVPPNSDNTTTYDVIFSPCTGIIGGTTT